MEVLCTLSYRRVGITEVEDNVFYRTKVSGKMFDNKYRSDGLREVPVLGYICCKKPFSFRYQHLWRIYEYRF